jgi:hypothetical protein
MKVNQIDKFEVVVSLKHWHSQEGRSKYTALFVIRVSDDAAGPPRCAGHAGTNGNSSCSIFVSDSLPVTEQSPQ